MNNEFKDYYKILGISPRATLENIQNATRREMSQNWNNAIGRLEVQEAYDILSNPERRKQYDEEFNRRLDERERAIRNARTFEEYVAAQSLHSELANVDVAPELSTSQEVEMAEKERVEQEKIEELSEEQEKQIESAEEEKELEESMVDFVGSSDSSESNSNNTEPSQEIEEEQVEEEIQEEQVEEEVKEEKTEEEVQEEKNKEEIQEEQVDQGEIEEKVQKFINIPIQRLEKEIVQSKESVENEKAKEPEEPIISSSAKKTIGKSLIIGGGIALGYLVIGGIPGAAIGFVVGVASGDFYKKHAGKIKLQREPKELKVTEIETEETKLIEEANQQLEDQIYELLSKPNNNYELEIAIIKYQNTKTLLEKRIEFKKSERSKKEKTLKEMEIEGLEKKLVKVTKKLEKLNDMIAKSKDSRLNKLNNEISQKEHEIIEIKGDKEETSKIDNLVVRQSRLINKRDKRANKMVLCRNRIARGQVILATVQSIKNTFKEILQPLDEQIEENVEIPKSL